MVKSGLLIRSQKFICLNSKCNLLEVTSIGINSTLTNFMHAIRSSEIAAPSFLRFVTCFEITSFNGHSKSRCPSGRLAVMQIYFGKRKNLSRSRERIIEKCAIYIFRNWWLCNLVCWSYQSEGRPLYNIKCI